MPDAADLLARQPARWHGVLVALNSEERAALRAQTEALMERGSMLVAYLAAREKGLTHGEAVKRANARGKRLRRG